MTWRPNGGLESFTNSRSKGTSILKLPGMLVFLSEWTPHKQEARTFARWELTLRGVEFGRLVSFHRL